LLQPSAANEKFESISNWENFLPTASPAKKDLHRIAFQDYRGMTRWLLKKGGGLDMINTGSLDGVQWNPFWQIDRQVYPN
jgi:hypothetical protein